MNLVELTVAIVILSLGVLGLAATADSAGRAMTRARTLSEAVARARVTLDSLRSRACRDSGDVSIRYLRDTVRAGDRQVILEGVALCP